MLIQFVNYIPIYSGGCKISVCLSTQGINFLEALTQLLKRRQLEVASIDGHCTAWLHLLVGLVDIMGDESVCLLKMFKETKLLRIYQKAINDEVRDQV